MLEIFKKEMRAHFSSAMGYILWAVSICISSVYFVYYNLTGLQADTTYVFQFQASWLVVFLAPMLTMRLLAEERRQKTDQMLLTYPVSITGIVLGKFFSALGMLGICLSINVVYFLITLAYGQSVMLGEFICYSIGMALLSGAVIALDLLISSLTESMMIAAFLSIGANIVLLLIKSLVSGAGGALGFVTRILSVFSRFFDEFARGVLSLTAVFYYLSFITAFLFLTVRVIEKRRWS